NDDNDNGDDNNDDDNNDDNDNDNDNSDLPPTYGVTYHPNGADAGSVPEDAAVYESGDTVTVLGDTGGLTRTDHTFSGWNSAADQGGTTYQAGDTIPVVDADIDLYAVWTPGGIVHIDFQNPDDPEILFAGAGDQVLKGAELAISVGGSYTGHEWYLDGSDTHTALTADGASATIATGDLGYGTHTVSLFVSGGYSASFSFDVVDTVQ
ncbi:MAG: InlB B-repeat-containing protein, partial [bacterium]